MGSEFPKETAGDSVHTGTRIALSLVPGIGGFLVEFFSAFVARPIERRREAWQRELADIVYTLESKLDPDSLRDNDLFVSLILETTEQALKTHQREKVRALRNVLINGVLQKDIDEDLTFVLLRFLDELTPTHLWTMRYLAQLARAKESVKSYEALYQEFARDTGHNISRSHFKLCCDELGMRKLVHLVGMDAGFDEGGGSTTQIENVDVGGRIVLTEIGLKFIRLVSNPEAGEPNARTEPA